MDKRAAVATVILLFSPLAALAGENPRCQAWQAELSKDRRELQETARKIGDLKFKVETGKKTRDDAYAEAKHTNTSRDWKEYEALANDYDLSRGILSSQEDYYQMIGRDVVQLEGQLQACAPATPAQNGFIAAKFSLHGSIQTQCKGKEGDVLPLEINVADGRATGSYKVWGLPIAISGTLSSSGTLSMTADQSGGQIELQGLVTRPGNSYTPWRANGTTSNHQSNCGAPGIWSASQ